MYKLTYTVNGGFDNDHLINNYTTLDDCFDIIQGYMLFEFAHNNLGDSLEQYLNLAQGYIKFDYTNQVKLDVDHFKNEYNPKSLCNSYQFPDISFTIERRLNNA